LELHLHHTGVVVDIDKGDVAAVGLDSGAHELDEIIKGFLASVALGGVDRLAI
jgi:hypothetical protein